MTREQRQLARQKIAIGERTMRKVLRECPITERLRERREIKVLDLGCHDGTYTLGTAQALAAHFRPDRVNVLGVDTDTRPFNVTLTHEEVQINLLLLKILLSQDTLPMVRDTLDEFDLVTIFNPSPPEDLLQAILRIRRQIIPQILAETVIQGEEALKDEILGISEQNLGPLPRDLRRRGIMALLNEIKFLGLLIPLRDLLPSLLAGDAVVVLTADGMILNDGIRKAFERSGYDVGPERENDPENIIHISPLIAYNRFIFTASLR